MNFNDKIKEEFNSRPKTTGQPTMSNPSTGNMPAKDSATFGSEKSHSTVNTLNSIDKNSRTVKPC